jgi:hypothetical protein
MLQSVVLRGGALEPDASACRLEKRTLKLTLIRDGISQGAAAEIFLSQTGPRFLI